MSLTLIVWLFVFVTLLIASLQRAVFAVALYFLTFFLLPHFWWWGGPLAGIRWNFIAGVVLLAVSIFSSPAKLTGKARQLFIVSLVLVGNMLLVNLLMAGNSEESFEGFMLSLKFFVLTYLIYRTVQNKFDLQVVMLSLILGAAYIGFECTVNERGDIVHNRLEGVGAPGATTANHFASMMIVILPMVAPFFWAGKLWQKLIAIIAVPLIVNVVLLCNSRGAFLAAILSGIAMIAMAPKNFRKTAIKIVGLGAIAVFLLLGDARIVERFMSTFASSEERDNSAQSRLDFWKSGILMIGDYPLGAGGNGFKKVHGVKYLRKTGAANVARAVHNGYINEACQWGIQGLLLRLVWYFLAIAVAIQSIRMQIKTGVYDEFILIAQIALIAATLAFLANSVFGDLLDAEWGHWLVSLLLTSSLIATKSNNEIDWQNVPADQ